MISLKLDLSDLLAIGDMKSKAQKALNDAARDFAQLIHAHLVEEATKKLKTRREMYINGLSVSQLDRTTWIVSLDAKVRWAEDGLQPHNMLEDLLASDKAKTSKDGNKYLVVPFEHGPGKGPTNTTPAQASLVATIKSELQRRNIPLAKIERGPNGQAKLGRLHSFSITDAPVKTANVPGQGKGAVGDVMQGPTGIPFLQNVNIYQSLVKQKGGMHRLNRSILTFRVASEAHEGQGNRWRHPGLEGAKLFDETLKWAGTVWNDQIAPGVIAKLIASLD